MLEVRTWRFGSVAGWGEIGVADPGVWSIVGGIARWGEIGVTDLGVWSIVGSIAGWGEIGVADPDVWSAVERGEFRVVDPGFLCLEPPSLAGL